MFDRHTHHHHHYGAGDSEVPPWAARLQFQNNLIKQGLEKVMAINTSLVAAFQAAVERTRAKDVEQLAAYQALRDQNKTLAASLADVSAKLAAMPAETAELEAVINKAVADLNATADAVEGAVAENKSVPDMPPAEPAA